MTKLDPLLHQELRLKIMSFLARVKKADFKTLLETTAASKGNLSVQISKLETAKFLTVKKTFKGNYPHTEYKITKLGNEKYENYLIELKAMLNL